MATAEIRPPAQVSKYDRESPVWLAVKEYAPTFMTEFAVMLSQIVVYKMADVYLGKQGFSEYAVARRAVALIFPVPMLGLSVGLPRYVSLSTSQDDAGTSSRYYGAAVTCVLLSALLCTILLNLFGGVVGYLFFGSQSYKSLVLPVSLMICGLCFHTIICCYFRGRMRPNRANVLQLVNLAIAPVLAFIIFPGSLARLLSGLGLLWAGVAALFVTVTPFRSIFRNNCDEVGVLLRYGVQRVPGDFILMALFGFPAMIVAHFWGIQQAGLVAFGMTALSMVGAIFAPTGLVLLPKATFLFARGAKRQLRAHLRRLVVATVGISTIIVLVVWLWTPELIHLYLGPDYLQVVAIVRLLMLGAVPYSLYMVLRIIVEAYHDYAVTGLILFVGLAIFGIGVCIAKYGGFGLRAILVAFLIGLFAVTVLSTWESFRILRA